MIEQMPVDKVMHRKKEAIVNAKRKDSRKYSRRSNSSPLESMGRSASSEKRSGRNVEEMPDDRFVDNPRRQAANVDAERNDSRDHRRSRNNSLLESIGASLETTSDIATIKTRIEARNEIDYDNSDLENAAATCNEEEYLAEVGEMNCYCVPTRVYGFKDFMFRSLGWTLLNKEQILGAFTGKNRIIITESIYVEVRYHIMHNCKCIYFI